MDGASKVMLYVVVLVPALFIAVFLLSLGPLGLFAAGFVVIAALATSTWIGDDAEAAPDRTNCAECGSPNPPTRKRCKYCDAPLDRDA